MLNVLQCQPNSIAGSGTTNIAALGINITVHTVVIPKTSAGTITLQDRAASPNTYYQFPASTVAGSYLVDILCNNGLAVVTSGADTPLVTTIQ